MMCPRITRISRNGKHDDVGGDGAVGFLAKTQRRKDAKGVWRASGFSRRRGGTEIKAADSEKSSAAW